MLAKPQEIRGQRARASVPSKPARSSWGCIGRRGLRSEPRLHVSAANHGVGGGSALARALDTDSGQEAAFNLLQTAVLAGLVAVASPESPVGASAWSYVEGSSLTTGSNCLKNDRLCVMN
jgi:hypothetical protein